MEKRLDLQEVLRTNLRVLLALRKMTAGELAAHLETDRTTVSKRMNGAREWALQDLAELSAVFDVPIDALIGDTSQLLGVAPSRMTGTDHRFGSRVTARVTSEYVPGNTADVIQFPQAGEPRRGYHSHQTGQRSTHPTTPRTSRRPNANAAV